MTVSFQLLKKPTKAIIERMVKWNNDPNLRPLIRHNKCEADLEKRMTYSEIEEGIRHGITHIIKLDKEVVGEIGYQIEPPQLFKKEKGTVWVSIIIGEQDAHGKGVGTKAMEYIEKEIKEKGFDRIELGVFEFNKVAQGLYKKMGYEEIGRVEDFTYWNGKMWQDIRMEKRI